MELYQRIRKSCHLLCHMTANGFAFLKSPVIYCRMLLPTPFGLMMTGQIQHCFAVLLCPSFCAAPIWTPLSNILEGLIHLTPGIFGAAHCDLSFAHQYFTLSFAVNAAAEIRYFVR